jgi:hypothetical protein
MARSRPLPFGHDAFLNDAKAFDPAKAEAMIASGVVNLEIDLGYRALDGKFYVTHDGDANTIPEPELSQREFVAVLRQFGFLDRGLKPHLDIKFSDTPDAVTQFGETLDSLPLQVDITLSGHDWPLLAKLARNPRVHCTLFTIDDQAKVASFLSQAKLRSGVPGRVGVSLRHDLATPENLALLRGAAQSIVVWTVNDPGEAAGLAQANVVGITSDNPAVFVPLLH